MNGSGTAVYPGLHGSRRHVTSNDGLYRCAGYAFAPNYYRYCGPDKSAYLVEYLRKASSDEGLHDLVRGFAVLYPYLRRIAHANGIADPFDTRVVEAYWIGNHLLDQVGTADAVEHVHLEQRLRDRLPGRTLKWITGTLLSGAKLHHSFHVFSVFTRTGHAEVDHTVETMDQCRIGWGKTIEISNSKYQISNIQIETQQLIYKHGKLTFQPRVIKTIRNPGIPFSGKPLAAGDWVTYHWGFLCERITYRQVAALRAVTAHNLALANRTV